MAPEVAQAQRAGLRSEIDRLVGTQLDDRVALHGVLLGEGDFNRTRLNTAFGEEPVAGLTRTVDRESAFDAIQRRILDDSTNDARRRAAEDVGVRELSPGSGGLGTVVAGAAGGAHGVAAAYGLKTGRLLANVLGLRADLARNRQLAGAVTLRQGDALEQLLKQIGARLAAQERAAQAGAKSQQGTAVVVHSKADRARPERRPFGFGGR